MASLYSHTQALCPQCRAKVQARLVERDDQVWLEKFCPVHGESSALVSADARWYRTSLGFVKPRQAPRALGVATFHGCPDSCGSCPEHRQHTCLPVIEITTDCDLDCPVCLKHRVPRRHMTRDEFSRTLDTLFHCEGGIDVLNLSGGEPTRHPELIDFLHLARERGVVQSTVSTNGLALLREPRLRHAFAETGAIAAVQFDGFRPQTWRALRGSDLAREKRELLECLEREGIRYSLVATLARGINAGPGCDEVAAIVDWFFRSRAVSLMFQPIALTGAAARFDESHRLTIPEVVQAIESQAPAAPGDFNPLPCSHASCFALAYWLILGDGRFQSLKAFLGEADYLNIIANRSLPGLDAAGFERIRNRLYDIWSLADAGSLGEQALRRIRQVLAESAGGRPEPRRLLELGMASLKAIFIHQFMDVHTLDYARLIQCCNPYPQPDGRLIPMCAQNVFFQ